MHGVVWFLIGGDFDVLGRQTSGLAQTLNILGRQQKNLTGFLSSFIMMPQKNGDVKCHMCWSDILFVLHEGCTHTQPMSILSAARAQSLPVQTVAKSQNVWKGAKYEYAQYEGIANVSHVGH